MWNNIGPNQNGHANNGQIQTNQIESFYIIINSSLILCFNYIK